MYSFHYLSARAARDTLANPINSGFKVGAHLETITDTGHDGLTFQAGNVEHNNSGLNMCADRFVLMMAHGKKLIPSHLYLVTDNKEPTFPCGVCRQYMSAWPSLKVTVFNSDGTEKITKTANQLLPNAFKRDRL